MAKPEEKKLKVVTQVEMVLQVDGEIFDNISWLGELRDFLVEDIGWMSVGVFQRLVEDENV
jgi:hypothetical protein